MDCFLSEKNNNCNVDVDVEPKPVKKKGGYLLVLGFLYMKFSETIIWRVLQGYIYILQEKDFIPLQ